MGVLTFDKEESTVSILGRRFPAVVLICPQEETYPERNEYDRSIGTAETCDGFFIPAENGLLFEVDTMGEFNGVSRDHLMQLTVRARTCQWCDQFPNDTGLWLPYIVSIKDGQLIAGTDGTWDWRLAEPEWVIEMIDRLSTKPFTQPPGPEMKLVRLDYFWNWGDPD